MCDRDPISESTRHALLRRPGSDRKRPYKLLTKLLISGLVIILILVSAVVGYLIGKTDYNEWDLAEPDPVNPLLPLPSWLRVFKRAAVCTDAPRCSDIGRHILSMNGSAVDATIAAMFCNEVHNHQSMGLGGGFFMTVYIKEERKAYSVIAREKAPAAATRDMFDGEFKKSFSSPLSVAVPGALRGMWAAHKRWGKLPWKSLVKPTLEFCKYGVPMTNTVYEGLYNASYIKNDHNLRKMYYNTEADQFYKPGTRIQPSEAYCNTLRIIAEKGGDELYNGTLAVVFAEDLKRAGTIITAEDLRNYHPKITDPIAVPLGDGDTLYTPPPPSSGAILVNILNILSGYNFTKDSINGTYNQILTYHRILEAFKYAYAARTKLADSDFVDLSAYIRKIISPEYGEEIRLRINDTITSNDASYYGAKEYNKEDSGTAYMSVIAENGDAVSLTSSINFYFGAGFTTLNTGIVMNNVMDDFSSPGIANGFGLQPSTANLIVPGKRPLSSISPSIIVDRDYNVKLVVGASGGTRILTSTALVTMRKLWFGQTIKEAVDEARIHHQIFPMTAQYQFGINEDILQGLRVKGHIMQPYYGRGSNVCAIYRNKTAVYGNADYRKAGDVAGID